MVFKVGWKIFLFCSGIIASSLLLSCSTKKNTAANRQWQAFNTRYNVYYNGDVHLRETLNDLERNYEDDYSRSLPVHPVEAYTENSLPRPSGDFTRTIEKMQKAIQLHSISRKPSGRTSSREDRDFRAREEFNPFLHNAWLTLGQAQFYNGDFSGAASTFFYITRHFKWLPETVTAARIWQARSYCALGLLYDAWNVLRLVKENHLHDKSLRYLYNETMADYLLRAGEPLQATGFLERAALMASGTQKTRLWFLLGQTYKNIGEKEKAFLAFKNAEGTPSTPYHAKFNARINQSEVYQGKNPDKEIAALKRMTRYGRNREYLDRIYYAIANHYLSKKDTAEAIRYYNLSVSNSERQGYDMALSKLALGNIYFHRREYMEAQKNLAEALPYLSENYPGYRKLQQKSDVLDELSIHAGNILLQDSLLRLSLLPEEKRIDIARKLADTFLAGEKAEREEAKRDEYLSSLPQNENAKEEGIPSGFTLNTDNSWYFYNTYTRNAGQREFRRKWGSRKLEDDWRRKNKSTFSLSDFHDEEAGELERDGLSMATNEERPSLDEHADNPRFPEYYLRQIPSTQAEREEAEEIIMEAIFNMGLILKDRLEDYKGARIEFLKLEERFPRSPYLLETWYNLYLMDMRAGNIDDAEIWRQKILSRFPGSNYGMAMTNPDYFNSLREMRQNQERIYERAYGAFLENDNTTVHELASKMETDYPMSEILPKFLFIDALAYFTDGNIPEFKDRLKKLLQGWPEEDVSQLAAEYMKGINAGRPLKPSGGNNLAMIWQIPLGEEPETEITAEEIFRDEPETPQYFILAFPAEEVNPNIVLFETARFNFSTFVIKDFDLEQMRSNDMGLLIVKGFENYDDVSVYNRIFQSSGPKLGENVKPIIISQENFEILLRNHKSFQDYFRFLEEKEEEELP